MKGHVDDAETLLRYQLSQEDVLGNTLADAFAERAGEVYQAYPEDVLTVKWHYSIVRKIQQRAIVIMTSVLDKRLPYHSAIPAAAMPRSLPVSALAVQSNHKFFNFAGTLHCMVCLRSSPAFLLGRGSGPCYHREVL